MKRYKFLEHDKITLPTGEVLTRIEYTSGPFEDAVGGYIENEDNLPHSGDGVVRDDAMVYGKASVWGGYVAGDAQVYGDASIYGDVHILGMAHVCGDAVVSGNGVIRGKAVVTGRVEGWAVVTDNARVDGGVYNNAYVGGDAVINQSSYVFGGVIDGRAVISSDVVGTARISGNACIENDRDVCHIQQGYCAPAVTVYKTKDEDGIEGLGCGIDFFGAYYNGSIDGAMDKVATRPDAELLKRFIELGVLSVATPEVAMSYGFSLEGK